MFGSLRPASDAEIALNLAPRAVTAARYSGPDRRRAIPRIRSLLTAALDEMDYGVVLLAEGGLALHLNQVAEEELDALHPLHLCERQIRGRRPEDTAALYDALQAAARRQHRKLLTLGEGAERVSVSVVPLRTPEGELNGPVTLLMLGKRRVCQALSVQGYALSHGLTSAESRVLTELCNGVRPAHIARDLGVAISTVRTQISTIRVKTGAQSIRDLVRQLARLPPLMNVLRTSSSSGPAAAKAAPGFAESADWQEERIFAG